MVTRDWPSHAPPLGLPKDQLDTPALCLDLDLLESNIRQMAERCRAANVAWRPHSKAHKSPDIAALQLAAGALGVTCAKLGEAEVMAHAGVTDILVANQIVGPSKLERLVALARRVPLIVAVDDRAQVDPLAAAVRRGGVECRVLVEVDIGLARAGVAPGPPAVELAARVARQPGLALAGIMGYEGHLLTVPDPAEKRSRIHAALELLAQTARALEHRGLPCPIVSAGGTGSYRYTIECPAVTELQAGGLIFMDAFYRHTCQVEEFQHALTLVTTIVSRPAADRAIVDAGRKSQHAELHSPRVVGRDDVHFERLSAEHGQFRLDATARELRVGDRLELIPGYSDFTTVLHDVFYGFRNGHLECIWPLAARGRLT